MKVEWIVEFTHFQFQLNDPESSGDTDPGSNIVEGHKVAILVPELLDFTVISPRYSKFCRLTIEVSETRPDVNLDDWDQAVECPLLVPSGEIVVWTPTGDTVYSASTRERVANSFEVPPAVYCALILMGNIETTIARLKANEDGLEYGTGSMPSDEELDALDFYHIHLWPIAAMGTRLLKQSPSIPD